MGFTTYCVPGTLTSVRSTRSASERSVSRLSPVTRMAIGASLGGPFSNSLTSMRAPAYAASLARRESSSTGVRFASYDFINTNSCAAVALSFRGVTL